VTVSGVATVDPGNASASNENVPAARVSVNDDSVTVPAPALVVDVQLPPALVVTTAKRRRQRQADYSFRSDTIRLCMEHPIGPRTSLSLLSARPIPSGWIRVTESRQIHSPSG